MILLVLLFLVSSTGNTLPFGFAERVSRTATCDDPSLESFLASEKDHGFHVQGWRWHTMALRRESARLGKLASQLLAKQRSRQGLEADDMIGLERATDYMVNFNMRGLHRIERDLFFPWIRSKFKERLPKGNGRLTSFALGTLDKMERQRSEIESIGVSLVKATEGASNLLPAEQGKVLHQVAKHASQVVRLVDTMKMQEDEIICPTISRLVSSSEQSSFNNRVLRKLGILDSRLHLVSMYDAVQDNVVERKLFQRTIPSIPQRMIPRWKRLLYEPRIGGLVAIHD